MRRLAAALFGAALATSAAAGAAPVSVTIPTRDGTKLIGVYQKAQSGHPTVVLLHGLASNKEEWQPFEATLSKAGVGFLAYDARGHGQSSTHKDEHGDPDGYKYFGPPGPGTPWERMVDDLGAVTRFLESEEKVDRTSIVLDGASVGANVTLIYAALSSGFPVVALSPGLEYAGLQTEPIITRLRHRALLVASPDDRYAFASVLRLKKDAPSVIVWTDVPSGHGVQMLDAPTQKRLLEWIESGR